MIRTKDFACEHCGQGYPDYPYEGKCPEEIPCECGQMATWARQRVNHIHTEVSSLYDRRDGFGGVDPRFGVPVTSYQEKKALLKERGLEETEIEHPDDIGAHVESRVAAQAATQRDPNTLIADSPEEIMEKINTDQIDRGATGDLSKREGLDKETGLVDSWGSF